MRPPGRTIEVGPTRPGGASWFALTSVALITALAVWLTWLCQ